MLVGDDLEGEGAEGLGVVRLANGGRVAQVDLLLRQRADDGGDVDRRGEEVDHGVEQRLHALVLEGGAAEDGDDRAGDGGLSERTEDFGAAERLAGEELLKQGVIGFRDLFDEVRAPSCGQLLECGGNLAPDDFLALALLGECERLHLDQVDHAAKGVGGADGDDEGNGVGLERGLDRLHDGEEVRADAVHLVDEGDLGDLVLLGLAPDLLGLRLDAADGAEQRDGAVEHAQGALDLGREVHVPRGVDEGDLVAAPHRGGGGGADRDAALLLLDHEVHGCRAVVDFAQLVGFSAVVEDAFAGRGLAGVDVRHDADVADEVEGRSTCHGRFLLNRQELLASCSCF